MLICQWAEPVTQCPLSSQGFADQVGQRGPAGPNGRRHRPAEVSQHPQVEEHNDVVRRIGHAGVSGRSRYLNLTEDRVT